MQYRTALSTAVVTLIGCAAIAGAQTQNAPNPADSSKPGASTPAGQDTMHLTQAQQDAIRQGLNDHQKQTAPGGFDGQVGSKVPDSMQTNSVPNNVSAQVPEINGLLFVKLPDRVLLIDPNNKAVLEIVADSSRTDFGAGGNRENTRSGTTR